MARKKVVKATSEEVVALAAAAIIPTKRRLKTPEAPAKRSKMADLIARMQASNPGIGSATSAAESWRYMDFIDPKTRLPSLTQEWLFGARGLLAGRIAQFRALYSRGKSTYMYLNYAAAQLTAQAFCYHMETEGAAAPPDYIAAVGCDPSELMVDETASLEDCLESIDRAICEVRGGFGGSTSDAGRAVKSKFTDPLDPEMLSPMAIGIDSMSSLGAKASEDTDIVNTEKNQQISWHTRKLREYFRDRAQRFKSTQTLLMLASHETANINTGGSFGGGAKKDDKSSLAQAAIGIHATYGIDFEAGKWWDKAAGKQTGDIITLTTFKNKLSPRYRKADLYLVSGMGFDLVKTDTEFLMTHPSSPFAGVTGPDGKPLLYRHSQGITCRPLQEKSFKTEREFLEALHDNKDLLMGLRENMRIRGFDFDFETNLAPEQDGVDPVAEEALDKALETLENAE